MTSSNNFLTQEKALELFEYRDGLLYWKAQRSSLKQGALAGHKHKDGYSHVCIDRKLYFVHRVIFLMHHGYLPQWPDVIDHIDGNGQNNKIENLRHATASQNMMNRRLQSNNTSGVAGVRWVARSKKWMAYIYLAKKQKCLGFFASMNEAIAARKDAETEHFKNFSTRQA